MYNTLKHEFRTPLNHIIGYCEMLLEEAGDGSGRQFIAELEEIHGLGRRLVATVNDLFDPVKSDAYKTDAALVERELRAPLRQIAEGAKNLQRAAAGLGAESFVSDSEKIAAAAGELLRLSSEHFAGAQMELGAVQTSVAAAQGTVFFRRPAAETAAEPSKALITPAPQASGSILVVDDDSGNRDMLTRRLARLGYDVDAAENGRAALERLRAKKFDLTLLDIQMPELDGYEVLSRLNADAALRDIPVIVLSASDETEGVARAIELGAEDYLPKPFEPALLQARIGASLEKKRLRDREVSHLRQIQEEKRRADELLHVILPHDVVAELKQTSAVKPRRCENVGVLFCDIVSFTAYCDKHAPEEIHVRLQALIEAFEGIAASNGLEKIKTIGDSFMATAGLLAPLENPALNCVVCGLAMIERARALPPHWQIRVGVHVGPVIAGVVGRRKYQYDVWGDTVNTAARLEHAATPGAVCVTAQTWELVSARCVGAPQGRTEIKGKGEMALHQITALRPAA